jgi:hypothetical protein
VSRSRWRDCDGDAADNAKGLEIKEKIGQIEQAIAQIRYLSSGTLLERTKICGNPSCRCASDPSARHGPYYEWSHLRTRKLRHQTLTPEQAELMRQAIANHRKVKKLLRAWESQIQRPILRRSAKCALRCSSKAVQTGYRI